MMYLMQISTFDSHFSYALATKWQLRVLRGFHALILNYGLNNFLGSNFVYLL